MLFVGDVAESIQTINGLPQLTAIVCVLSVPESSIAATLFL